MSNSSSPSVLPALNPLDIPLTDSHTTGLTSQPSPNQQPLSLPPADTIPEVSLTFLVMSGNSRRSMLFPASATISRVKELVWTTWPTDWPEGRPPAPNYLRFFYYGKPLQDEEVLESKFPKTTPPPPPSHSTQPSHSESHPPPISTIVHLAIRTNPPPTEIDDIKKKKRRMGSSGQGDAGAEADRAGCCSGCIIS